jgi:hypothetical protein
MGALSWAFPSAGSGAIALALFLVGVITAVFRFLKWLIIFVCDRLDIGREELWKRVKHLEQEMDDWREVAMSLLAALAKVDPDNPALLHATRILRQKTPIATQDLDELVDRLNQIPGSKEGEKKP